MRISRALAHWHLLGSVLFSARSSHDREGRRQLAYDGSHHRLTGRPVSQPACTYQRQKWAPPAPVCALPVSAPPVGGWCLCSSAFSRTQPLRPLVYVYKVAGARRRVQNTRYARSTHRVAPLRAIRGQGTHLTSDKSPAGIQGTGRRRRLSVACPRRPVSVHRINFREFRWVPLSLLSSFFSFSLSFSTEFLFLFLFFYFYR